MDYNRKRAAQSVASTPGGARGNASSHFHFTPITNKCQLQLALGEQVRI